MIFLQYGHIDVLDGAFVLIDKTGIRTHIPVGSVACIMLEPGTSFPTRRIGRHGGDATGLVGEAGVRVTPPDNPEGRGRMNYSYQAKLALTEDLRLKVVRKMLITFS